MKFRRIVLLLIVVAMLLAVASPALAQNSTHVVQPGETLFSIARSFGLTVEQLAAANGITNPALIYVGQVLVIPGGAPSPTPGTGAPQTYVVQVGDTLYRIALRFGTTVDVLVSLNGLTNSNVLYVGQVLIINPGGGTTQPTSVPATNVPPPPTTAPGNQTVTYTVQPGDTLLAIAIRFGTTVSALVQLNGLASPDVISVGQVLTIKQGSGQPQPTATPQNQTVTYTVKPGDTLGQIALRFGTTYQQIALLNNLSNPDIIAVGQVLIIKQGSGPQPTPIPATTVAPTGVATTAVPTTVPTVVPTAVPTTPSGPATPTQIVGPVVIPSNASNLVTNSSFTGQVRPVIFGEVNVFESWEPFYCDQPYTQQKCPAPRQGSGNPPGLMMGRPEYKPTDVANRVHSGKTAQQWFCFWRTCDAGIFQTVTTTPGAVCVAGAFVQSWSANGTGFTSDLQTADQRANSTWFIRVDPTGGTSAFANSILISRGFGYGDGIYDKYVEISYQFAATSNKATVFFENLRLWPISNNDNYIDDVYVRCTK